MLQVKQIKYQSIKFCMSFFIPLGVELHRGHGGKDTEVSERAQTMPGVRSRGAQLLETAFERARGPAQRRLRLRSLLQDTQPPLCRVGWVPLFQFNYVGMPQKPIIFLPFLRLAPILFSTREDCFMNPGTKPNQWKSVSCYT